jgi:hypothetical protein
VKCPKNDFSGWLDMFVDNVFFGNKYEKLASEKHEAEVEFASCLDDLSQLFKRYSYGEGEFRDLRGQFT